jgi:hypothetical protein
MKVRSLFCVGILFVAGCGGTAEVGGDDEAVASSDDALSTRAELVGGWDAKSGSFTGLAFKADGTFFYEHTVYCVRAPCYPITQSGHWTASRSSIYLALGGGVRIRWGYTLNPRGILTLTDTNGLVLGTFTKQGTYCRTTTQCEGQSYPALGCVGYTTCDETTNRCGYSCGLSPCSRTRCASGSECVAHPGGIASCEWVSTLSH